jgi:GNAT superfamily N-acetyltransferase
MSDDARVRPLAEGDVDALAGELGKLPLLSLYGRGPGARAGDLRAALARGDGLLVFEPEPGAGAPTGLAWFLPNGTFGLGAYLRLLAVAGGKQGKGAGSALLAAFEQASKAQSRHAFALVSGFNAAAQKFYEKHGYAKVGAVPSLVQRDVEERIYWKRIVPLA